MEIVGVIVSVLETQSGTSSSGKEWSKVDFILETEGQYPKKVCITAFGKISNDDNITEGNMVKVAYNLESKEYNNKWYTSVNAWRITGTKGGVESQAVKPEPTSTNSKASDIVSLIDDDLPF